MLLSQSPVSAFACVLLSNGRALPARMSVITPVARGMMLPTMLVSARAIRPMAIAGRYRLRYGAKPSRFFEAELCSGVRLGACFGVCCDCFAAAACPDLLP